MSPANINYIKRNNPQLDPAIIEENPNSIEIVEITRTDSYRKDIFKKYNIPSNSTVLLYGGNFGKPQGIDFLIKVLESNLNNSSVFFFLVGSGTEYKKLNNWFTSYMPSNAILIPGLPKADYDLLVQACDVGMIFLDNRFTIPNFPSRLLSYLENKLPVLVATDENSDMGIISERNNFGFYSKHGDISTFNKNLNHLLDNKELIKNMGENAYNYLLVNYTVDRSYKIIMNHFN